MSGKLPTVAASHVGTSGSGPSITCLGNAEVMIKPLGRRKSSHTSANAGTVTQGAGQIMRSFGATVVGGETRFDEQCDTKDRIKFENGKGTFEGTIAMVSSSNTVILEDAVQPPVSKATSFQIIKGGGVSTTSSGGGLQPLGEDDGNAESYQIVCAALNLSEVASINGPQVDVKNRVMQWGKLRVAFPSWSMVNRLLDKLPSASARLLHLSDMELAGLPPPPQGLEMSHSEQESRNVLAQRLGLGDNNGDVTSDEGEFQFQDFGSSGFGMSSHLGGPMQLVPNAAQSELVPARRPGGYDGIYGAGVYGHGSPGVYGYNSSGVYGVDSPGVYGHGGVNPMMAAMPPGGFLPYGMAQPQVMTYGGPVMQPGGPVMQPQVVHGTVGGSTTTVFVIKDQGAPAILDPVKWPPGISHAGVHPSQLGAMPVHGPQSSTLPGRPVPGGHMAYVNGVLCHVTPIGR